MAFESLTDRLAGVFKKLRGHGKLTEADIKAAMREVRMALLEADVNYKVAKDFCAKVSERAMGVPSVPLFSLQISFPLPFSPLPLLYDLSAVLTFSPIQQTL